MEDDNFAKKEQELSRRRGNRIDEGQNENNKSSMGETGYPVNKANRGQSQAQSERTRDFAYDDHQRYALSKSKSIDSWTAEQARQFSNGTIDIVSELYKQHTGKNLDLFQIAADDLSLRRPKSSNTKQNSTATSKNTSPIEDSSIPTRKKSKSQSEPQKGMPSLTVKGCIKQRVAAMTTSYSIPTKVIKSKENSKVTAFTQVMRYTKVVRTDVIMSHSSVIQKDIPNAAEHNDRKFRNDKSEDKPGVSGQTQPNDEPEIIVLDSDDE